MKVAEIRGALKKYDQNTLIELFVNAYKVVPKAKREELLDAMIADYQGTLEKKKASGNGDTIVDFGALEREINEFIDDAYSQNYFAPNRKISKAKRPKWRFMVKDYYKQLIKIKADVPYYESSVKLLCNLYEMLCYGCNYYIFSTDDPFRSIGILQQEFYRIVAERTFAAGYSPEKVKKMILLAVSDRLSRDALNMYMYSELIQLLKTADLKYMAIEEGKLLISEEDAKYQEGQSRKKKRYSNNYNDYAYTRKHNEITQFIMYIYVELGEVMEGVSFFYKMLKESNKEITMYILLGIVGEVEDDKIWKQVYEDGIRRRIKPRESLREEYEELQTE